MSVGPDETTDWVNASPNPGFNIDNVGRDVPDPGITTAFTTTFTFYYQPTTGLQESILEFDNAGNNNVVLAVDIKYTGTGAGSITTIELYDDVADTGFVPIVLPPGQAHAMKITYDGTAVRLYANGDLVTTWNHTLAYSSSLIAYASVYLKWVTGFGSDIFVKDWHLVPGIH